MSVESYIENLKDRIQEEKSAATDYSLLAFEARGYGLSGNVRVLTQIAEDEERHAEELEGIVRGLEVTLETALELATEEQPYSWRVTNIGTGEMYDSTEEYVSVLDAEGGGRSFVATELRRMYVPRGYRLQVLNRWGEVVHTVAPAPGEVVERPPRPFPQTYGDWVNLGMDIKEKSPDITTVAEVNKALISIAEDKPGVAEDAMRYLVQKAGELGIS